jgi:hypothetical protein
VEATLVPGASIARVARENGVNANQVFLSAMFRSQSTFSELRKPRRLPFREIARYDRVDVTPLLFGADTKWSPGPESVRANCNANCSNSLGAADAARHTKETRDVN